jgi:hypothetical protein
MMRETGKSIEPWLGSQYAPHHSIVLPPEFFESAMERHGKDDAAATAPRPQQVLLGSDHHHRVRAAISLNNMAISLLADRHRHRQAHLLWMDAVSVLQLPSSRARKSSSASSSDDDVTSLQATRAVQRAERLFRQQPPDSVAALGGKRRAATVHVLSDDLATTMDAVNRSLVQCCHKNRTTCGARTRYLVRIESHDFDDDPKQEERVSATIFYNYATSILLQSDAYPPSLSVRQTKLRTRGALILNVAMGLVASSVPNPDQRSDAEWWWLLRLLIEASSTRVLAQLGEAEASQRRFESLQQTSRHLAAYQHVLNMMRAGRQVAAAA